MQSRFNILMTGAGAPGAPGIIHCLSQANFLRLFVADADPDATGRYLNREFLQIPKADDPAYIETVLKICKEQNIRVLLPLVTKELFQLSSSRHLFEKINTKVLVSEENSIGIANNKSRCYESLKDAGIAVPRFFVVKTVEEFVHAAFELGHPKKSFCFKPSISNGSRGVRIVSDSLDESEQLFGQKPYNLHISYAHALQILSSKPFPELLVTEYLPGEEFSVDCLADHGKAHLVIPRSRKKMVNGISVQGEFLHDSFIVEYCGRVIEALNLHGNIGIQMKRSDQNIPQLLEINPRVQGTIVAALGAGVNLPLLAIKQELGLPVDPKEYEIKWGTRFSRFWTEVYY